MFPSLVFDMWIIIPFMIHLWCYFRNEGYLYSIKRRMLCFASENPQSRFSTCSVSLHVLITPSHLLNSLICNKQPFLRKDSRCQCNERRNLSPFFPWLNWLINGCYYCVDIHSFLPRSLFSRQDINNTLARTEYCF